MSDDSLYTTLNITIEEDKVAARPSWMKEEESDYSPLYLDSDKLDCKVLHLCRQLIDDDCIHSKEDFKLVGRLLNKMLFTDKVKEYFSLVLRSAKVNAKNRMRVGLEFRGQDIYGLSKLPWEYLLYKDVITGRWEFVSTVAELTLTRYLHPKQSGKQAVVPLNEKVIDILLVLSNPGGALPCLEQTRDNVRSQLKKFKKRLTAQKITVNIEEFEGPVTWDSFQAKIKEEKCAPHILHLIAHGQFEGMKTNRAGSIAFLARDDTDIPTSNWVSDSSFASLFANVNKLPRFAFLHMCEGGAFDKQEEGSSAGVALRLAEEGVPAIVAMQHNIRIDMATDFSKEFYDLLGEGYTIDEAVQWGRSKIEQKYENDRAFGTPVLFLSTSSDTVLPNIRKKTGETQGVVSALKIITITEYQEYLFPLIQNAVEKGLKQEIAMDLDNLFQTLINDSISKWLAEIDDRFRNYKPFETDTPKARTLCAELRKKIIELRELS